MNKHLYILSILSCFKNKDISPIRIQLLFFMIGQSLTRFTNVFSFVPHDFGPYCREIFLQLNHLKNLENINVNKRDKHICGYKVTDVGYKRGNDFFTSMPEKEQQTIDNIINFTNEFDDDKSLLSYILSKYPEYQSGIIFQK